MPQTVKVAVFGLGSTGQAVTRLLLQTPSVKVIGVADSAPAQAGKDLGVAVTSPAIILYGGGTDGFNNAQGLREGSGGGPFLEVLAMPVTFLFGAVKHTLYCGIYAVDFLLFPIYGVAELFPDGPDVEPLDYYTGTPFDLPTDGQGRASTDPTSGEDVPPGYNVDR